MTEQQPEKPKIIVDDNWKERVQAEKEAAQKEKTKPEQPAAADKLPPASFPMLVTSLATQALAALGQLPDPSGKPVVQLDYAKHLIDTIAILEEKTKGNLSREETSMLAAVLHELRMVFVSVRDAPARPPKPDAPGA